MDQNMWRVHPYKGILPSSQKEQRTDVYHTMADSQQYVQWKKPVTKAHVLYGSIYMNCLEEAPSGCQGLGVGVEGRNGECLPPPWGFFVGWLKCSKIGMVMVAWVCEYTKTTERYTLNR